MRGTMKAGAIALAALLIGESANATVNEPSSVAQKSDKASEDTDGHRIICRRIDSHARSGERICATLNDWKAYRRYVSNDQTRGKNNPWGLTAN